MTDQRQRFAQQFPTPQRTQVLPQQGWQPAPPPQGHWQPAQQWPHQPYGQAPQVQPHVQAWPQQQSWQPPWQPPVVQGPPAEEKNGATIAHAGVLVAPVVVALLMLLTAKNKPFQRAAALQASLVQGAAMLLSQLLPLPTAAALLAKDGPMRWLSFLPIVLVAVCSFAFAVVGASRATNGRVCYVPLVGRSLAKLFGAEWHG